MYLMSIYSDKCEIDIQSLPDWSQVPPTFSHASKLIYFHKKVLFKMTNVKSIFNFNLISLKAQLTELFSKSKKIK